MEQLNWKTTSTTALAYIGDAVYEVYIREYLLTKGQVYVDAIHKTAIEFVSAVGQAKAMKTLRERKVLLPEEEALGRRAKNRKITSKPRNVDPMTYKYATAFEALIGMLYLDRNFNRLQEIVDQAIKIVEDREDKDE